MFYYIYLALQDEDTLQLGKLQINLYFLSPCSIFATMSLKTRQDILVK